MTQVQRAIIENRYKYFRNEVIKAKGCWNLSFFEFLDVMRQSRISLQDFCNIDLSFQIKTDSPHNKYNQKTTMIIQLDQESFPQYQDSFQTTNPQQLLNMSTECYSKWIKNFTRGNFSIFEERRQRLLAEKNGSTTVEVNESKEDTATIKKRGRKPKVSDEVIIEFLRNKPMIKTLKEICAGVGLSYAGTNNKRIKELRAQL